MDTPIIWLVAMQVIRADAVDHFDSLLSVTSLKVHRLPSIREIGKCEIAGIELLDDLVIDVAIVLATIDYDRCYVV
jgi:hypothetical protein